jgi:hypothetical protein
MFPGLQNFRPNPASNRAIRFSNERGIDVNPTGEGVVLPKTQPLKTPMPNMGPRMAPPKFNMGVKPPRLGRRYYGQS